MSFSSVFQFLQHALGAWPKRRKHVARLEIESYLIVKILSYILYNYSILTQMFSAFMFTGINTRAMQNMNFIELYFIICVSYFYDRDLCNSIEIYM